MTHRILNQATRARRLLWAVIPAVLLAVFVGGCAEEEATVVVERRDIVAYLPLEGKTAVPAAARAEIMPPYQAPVDKIYVTVGKAVQKGDVVMELSAPRTEVRYQQAREQVRRARQDLEQAKAAYEAELNTARQRLEQARAAEAQARQQAQAQEQQVESDGVSVTVTQSPNPELAQAIQKRRMAERAVLDAKARRDEALVPYQRQLAAAQQELEQAQGGLKVASIRTPISGTVLDVNAEIGDKVDPDQKRPLAVVVDLDAVKVYAGVDNDNLDAVEHNDPAIVTVNPLPKMEFPGEVQQVYSERAGLLKGEKFVAVVDFQNKQGKAKPGMEAIARVRVGKAEDVLAVPADAVYEVDGKPAVKIRQNNEWQARVVETGVSDGEYTEIKSGLEEGQVVLANP